MYRDKVKASTCYFDKLFLIPTPRHDRITEFPDSKNASGKHPNDRLSSAIDSSYPRHWFDAPA